MYINMLNVVGITVTHKAERIPMLIGVMSCILANVHNFEWHVYFQYDGSSGFLLRMMVDLAKINNNKVKFHDISESESVGQVKAEFVEYYRRELKQEKEYLFNIDDDMLYSADTLYYIGEATTFGREKFFIVTQFDVNAERGFVDYDNDVRDIEFELKTFIKVKGENVVAHHLWDYGSANEPVSVSALIPVRAMSSGWIVRMIDFENLGLIRSLKEWPKGKRGYDIFMCMEFIKNGTMPKFIVPTRGYHIGLGGNYYNDEWKEHKEGIKEEWNKKYGVKK